MHLQRRLVENARASGDPITIALVKRFLPKTDEDPPGSASHEPSHREGPPVSGEDRLATDEEAGAAPPSGGSPERRIAIYLRAGAVPTLLGHFGLRDDDPPDPGAPPPDDAAALLAAYLESLVEPSPTAFQT